jgi:hypothetical protein
MSAQTPVPMQGGVGVVIVASPAAGQAIAAPGDL